MAFLTKETDPGTTYSPAWASPLAAAKPLTDAFVALARPASLIGKLEGLVNRVPFNVSVPAQTSGSTYAWVGQGAPKPVGNLQFQSVTMPILKAAGLLIVTRELLDLTQPASVLALRRELIRGLAHFLDMQLVDNTIAAVANVSPASITNGAPSIPARARARRTQRPMSSCSSRRSRRRTRTRSQSRC
jgi:hypothetical protein